MVGGTLYLVGRNAQTGELLHDATSCAMCRRMVINAGLSKVIIRTTASEFSVVDVQDWVNLEDDVPDLQSRKSGIERSYPAEAPGNNISKEIQRRMS